METLKQWCITVSAVSIVSGVLMYLLPKSSAKNTYRVLMSIILLYTLILPLANLQKLDFDFSAIIPQNNTDIADSHESELYVAQKTYEKYIESALEEISDEPECECICSYDEGELILQTVIIKSGVSQQQKAEILHKLENIGNKNTTVLFRGDKE